MTRVSWIAGIIAVLAACSWLFKQLISWLSDQGTWGHAANWIILAGLLALLLRSFRKPASTPTDA